MMGNRWQLAAAVFVAAAMGGCAGLPPRLFPPVPIQWRTASDGTVQRDYDTDGNSQVDYREFLSADGRLMAIGFLRTDGEIGEQIDLQQIPATERRYLTLILDSVPFALIEGARLQGRFSAFAAPSRVIAPFPVMTDLSLSELFGAAPCPGVESLYYTGKCLSNGYGTYVGQGNVPWAANVDYVMWPVAHASTYLDPPPWYHHELRAIQQQFYQGTGNMVGYVVGTSALGARGGRNGHAAGLIELDRFCQQLIHDTRGRVCISLLSDHGHYLHGRSRRVPLADQLRRCGYRVVTSLRKPGDVVVPEFGMVSCAAIHTHQPQQVATDAVGFEGVELSAYLLREPEQVVVLSQCGRAEISRKGNCYRYRCTQGDPLELRSTWTALEEGGQVDAEGYVDDAVLWQATVAQTYPDAVHRLWRAFHGLVANTPDVLISVENGYHCGSAMQDRMIDLVGVHGSLRPESSSGFAMTMGGPMAPVVRMENLGVALRERQVPIPCKSAK